jgi:hypothetical protein
MAIDETKLNEFMGRFVGDLGAVLHAPLIVIGDKLGLYKALATGAQTAAELARKTETAERYVAQFRGDTARVIKLAIDPRHDLHPGGAQIAFLLVGLKRGHWIVRHGRDLLRQHHCIFGRHAGALREILQHRMRSIAEQGDAALRPILHRLAVAQDPHAPGVDELE